MSSSVIEIKNYYYKLVDCCSGQTYVYPQGHYLAGFPIYIMYDGNETGYSPLDIIRDSSIITSITDSLGFEIKGCLILQVTDAPLNQPPINLQNWADVFYDNVQITALCCDCNSSCSSLFFQWQVQSNILDQGQYIWSFVGATGNYGGRPYYQIIVSTDVSLSIGSQFYYVWFSTQEQAWVVTDTLGDATTILWQLNSNQQIPASFNTITDWEEITPLRTIFQSYICKQAEPASIPSEYKYPEERYQLTCCSTGEALVVNGLPGVFVFQGLTSNNNHPDDFLEVVLTTIKDINANVITGCYRVTEAECFEEWEEILWQDFFVETECVSTCQECLPKPVTIPPITNHKIIYPDFIINNANPIDAEQIFCAFGDANYQKVLALRYGIQFCCPTDLMQSTIEHEILKMDITEDPNACCPVAPLPGTCKKYSVIIPIDVEGWLYFKDCSGVKRTVMFHSFSTPYEVFVCGTTGQTPADIYILANNQSLIQVQFSEGVDCN